MVRPMENDFSADGLIGLMKEEFLRFADHRSIPEVELDPFRKIFKKLFAKLQRSKILEKYIYLKDNYLVTADFSWVTDIIIT
jgi:hypothetical protein